MLPTHLREGGDYQPHLIIIRRRVQKDAWRGSSGGARREARPSEASPSKRKAVLFSVLDPPASIPRGEARKQGRQDPERAGRRGTLASRSPEHARTTGTVFLQSTQASVMRCLFSPLLRAGEKRPRGVETRRAPLPSERSSRPNQRPRMSSAFQLAGEGEKLDKSCSGFWVR